MPISTDGDQPGRHPVDPESAQEADLDAVIRLLDECGLPTSDLTARHLEHFLVVRDAGALVACAGLELFGTVALIRSVAVRSGDRARGLGSLLTAGIERRAASGGATEAYLLTTTADRFFATLGYASVDREEAPPALRSTAEFTELCPASATLMRKTLIGPSGLSP